MNLIFDIGYNKGDFTAECFRIHPECKVVGVEANLSLVYNKPLNPQLTLIHALVASGDNLYEDFYIEPNQNGISTASTKFMENSRFAKGSKNLPPNSADWELKTQVKTITLDELTKTYGRPDLLKIDVEGYEYEVLRGLTTKQQMISFEWHEEDAEGLLNCVEHLQQLGYREFGTIGYFDEGNVFEKVTYSDQGDPYLTEPEEYYSWEELNIKRLIKPQRRVNYGMMFVR